MIRREFVTLPYGAPAESACHLARLSILEGGVS